VFYHSVVDGYQGLLFVTECTDLCIYTARSC